MKQPLAIAPSVHSSCIQRRVALWFALLTLVTAICTGALHAQPDLTAGGVPNNSEYINLGPTGMEGWIYNSGSGKLNETGDARQILVTAVDPGSPADGILAVNDVILGADGTGAAPVNFTSDARKALAYAIDDAEGNNPAELKLIRWRSGISTTVTITLDYLGGSYTATAPYSCPKSAAILDKGVDYIMNNVTGAGYGGFGTTVLMAANDAGNPDNATRQARAAAEALALNLTAQQIADMTSGDLTRAIGKPWNIGPPLITQAEYYLQTGDSSVLPSIQARAIQIANAQSLFGTMGHSYSLPGPNGEINGPYGIGYGPVNNAGMPCFIGLILAEKCGLTDPEILAGIDRASKYFQYYTDLGTVPYGENKETGSIANNGKSGLNALALGMVGGYDTEAKYFAKLSVFGASERDGGHTGPYFNHLWTPLGANAGGQDAMANYFATTSWLYDLARTWEGDFVYHPYYQSGGIRGYGQGHEARWTTLLTYAAPLAQLHITGKVANPAMALDTTDLTHIDFAKTYDPTTRTTAELIEDLKSPLPQLHWSAGGEIGTNRTADHASILPTIINMAQNGTTYAERHGAIYALNKIKDDSTASVLASLCADPNSKVRYMAANALSNLSMAAKTAEVTNIVNALIATDRPLLPLDPENPMHVEKMSFATLLFDSSVGIWGGSRVNTADRALFYPAFRIIAGAPMGVTVRDKAFSVAPYLTKADVEELAETLVDVALSPPPGEISYGCRSGAINAMQVNDFAEGVPAAVIAFNDMTRTNNQNDVLDLLAGYAGSNLTVQPDPNIVDFCQQLISNSDDYDVAAQAVLDAIAADQLPTVLTPFKRIDWIFADDAELTLPAASTVLRLQSTDFANGVPAYTWRKVHGAGDVSFSPNGTAAAKDTTVVFDGTPGVYTFEVTMSDDRGLTETTETVTVTLNDTGGTLPPNTAPTADYQSVTAGQGTPTQIILTGSDPEGQELTYTVLEGPSNGYLSGTAPYLVYTSDLTYTGADSIVFEVMDTEGLVSATATVDITVDPVAAVGVALYEPFDYPAGVFNGSAGATEVGLDGAWTAHTDLNIIGGSLGYGSLVTDGGSIGNVTSGNNYGGHRAINPAALAGNGLLDDGATLWFSAVLGYPGSNYNKGIYLALANDQFKNAGNSHYIIDDGAQLGAGVGVAVNGNNVYACHFRDVSQGGTTSGHVYGTFDNYQGSIGSYNHRLVVGKITWGAASDTIELYLPWDDLELPPSPSSTITVDVEQSTFDTLTFSRNGSPLIDEIRMGATYQSVIQGTTAMLADTTAPTPDPMTFAVAPAPASPSSITMTATPAYDVSGVEYYFTCTAGGGNDSGWQTSNVYTDTGLTPGVQYSYTVKARDPLPAGNETVASGVASATIPLQATVPNLVGILQSSAEQLVVDSNLTVGAITDAVSYSLTVPDGHVLTQTPTAGSSVAYGSTVDLEISIGQDPALPTLAAVDIVDDQSGGPVVVNTLMVYTLTFSEDMDHTTLQAADFANAGSAAVTIGTITETSPGVVTVEVTPTTTGSMRFAVAAGATIQDAQGDAYNSTYDTIDDTVITINLPDEIVPNVVGLAQATAEANIVAANLTVGTINSIYDEVVAAGNVISQDPVGGSSIPGLSPVNLVVSLGVPPDTTGPVVVGMSPADGDYNVEVDASLELVFDEFVFVNTGNIVLRNLNDESELIIAVTDVTQVSTYSDTLTITPSVPLAAGKSYAVRVAAGSVVDASGNPFDGISDTTTWNFSTALTSLSTVLFSEDFEAPDVAAYTQGTWPGNWVGANQGFNSGLHGMTDKSAGDFSAPDPNFQGYAFRGTNSGLTTAEGVIGTIAADTTYEVSFDVVRDDGSGGDLNYSARMLAFDPGALRNDCRSNGTAIQLASKTGTATGDGYFTRVTLQATVNAGDPAVGKDLTVRFIGSSTSAIVDNLVVRTISPNVSDQVAPAIAALTPADDSINVSLVDNLRIEFDEDVLIEAGYITLRNLTTASDTIINIIDGVQVLLSGTSIEINPTDDLDTNTYYAVHIDAGAITDLAGNAFPGISDDLTWTFNTGDFVDVDAPLVVGLDPANSATGVSYSTNLTMTFNENVVVNSGNITLKNLTDATETVIDVTDSSQLNASANVVTINPASYLAEGKTYAVQVDAGAILDLAGNPYAGISDDVTWSFVTSATNPPAVLALTPPNSSVGVDPGSNLQILFDEPIQIATGNLTLRNISDVVDTVIDVTDASQVSVSGSTLTINPTSNLSQGKTYAVLMDAGAVEDLAANDFAGITSEATWTFVTGVSSEGQVFFEDFEVASGSPDVDAAGSTGNTSKQTGPNWVRASTGFGSDRHGIVDESSGQFSDPTGEQAYAFRYTNSGITTVEGAIGTLASGVTYTISFYVVQDGHNVGDAYNVGLATFAPGASRTDLGGMGNGTSMVLATASGSYSGTSYQLVTFEYTSDGVADAAVQGHDLAIRVKGATTTATVDNIQVTVAGGGDTTPPTLAGTDIVDNQGGGPVVANTPVTYTVTFNEDMAAASVEAADFGNAGSSIINIGAINETSPGVFTVAVTPTNAGTLQLQVNAGAVLTDAAGNPLDTSSAIVDDTTITVDPVPDSTPPTLLALDPLDGAVDVPVASNLTMTFDEDIATGSGNLTLRNLTDVSDTVIAITDASQISISGNVLTINPTSDLLEVKAYAVLLDAGAITDLAANAFGGIADETTWDFVTADATAPTLSPTDMVDDQGGGPVGVGTLVTYTVTFSEDMDETTVGAADFENAGSAFITIGAISEISPGVFSVEVTPTSAGSLQLSVGVGAVLNDVSGNPLDTTFAIADDTVLDVNEVMVLTSVTPSTGVGGTIVSVDIDGSGLTADCTARLVRAGYSDIIGTSVQLVGNTLRCDMDLTGAAAGPWTVEVTNPSLQSDSLVDAFTVIGVLWEENFDSSPAGWVSEQVTGTNAWVLTSAQSHTPTDSYFAPCPAAKTTTRLVSPTIAIPADGDNLQLKFWHSYDMENLVDGGILELSIDDGFSWFRVEDAGSGATYSLNGPVATLASGGKPADRNELDGLPAWTGNSGAFVQTVVDLATGTYAGVNLRARWTIGTNAKSASTGWYVDSVSLVGSGTFATSYGSWAGTHGSLTDATPALDFDGSGLSTGAEWALGGDPTNPADDPQIMPTLDDSDPNDLIYTFRRADDAEADPNTTIGAEYGSDLLGWTAAVHNGSDITTTVTDDGAAVGVDLVEIRISRSLAIGNKMFVRLKVEITNP